MTDEKQVMPEADREMTVEEKVVDLEMKVMQMSEGLVAISQTLNQFFQAYHQNQVALNAAINVQSKQLLDSGAVTEEELEAALEDEIKSLHAQHEEHRRQQMEAYMAQRKAEEEGLASPEVSDDNNEVMEAADKLEL